MQATPTMLVLDLDGTTLTRRGEIAPRDVAAVSALRARGVVVTIATGRIWSGTAEAARRLGVTGPVACMNGSELVDATQGRAIAGRYLDRSTRLEARRVLSREGLQAFVFAEDAVHTCEAGEPYVPIMRIWSGRVRHHERIWEAGCWERSGDCLAVAAFGRRSPLERAAERLRSAFGGEMEVLVVPSVRSPSGYLMVRDPTEDKGTALRRLAAHHGRSAAACVAVGDWVNDLPMFAAAGRSFAMGQASPAMRAAATDVLEATHTTGGGIAEVARRVWGVEVPDEAPGVSGR